MPHPVDWRRFAPVLLAFAPLGAQSPAALITHSLSGIVFDSIAGAPLAGAVVQVALADQVQRVFTTRSDVTGHFRIDGLPSGRFGVVFQHDALNALGLESPLRAVELAGDSSIRLDLGVPSGPTVRAQRCLGLPSDAGDGMIAGYLYDATHDNTLAGATVDVRWVEIAFQKGDLRQSARRVTATVGGDGTYLACGVASDAPVEVSVTRAGFRTIAAQIVVPSAGVVRQDFHLATSDVVHGAAAIAGHVVQEDGHLVANGRATIPPLSIDVPVTDGEFTIAGIPAGTWPVEIRALGYEPQAALVNAAERTSVPLTVAVARKAQTLETVNVVGNASRDTRTLDDIAFRNRTSGGTTLMPGNSWLATADSPTDALRGARGFIQKGANRVIARPYVDARGRLTDCATTRADTVRSGKEVAIYLDGSRYPGGLEILNNDVLPRQILAIEAYPDVVSAPMIWRTNDACAVVAIWTKH